MQYLLNFKFNHKKLENKLLVASFFKLLNMVEL